MRWEEGSCLSLLSSLGIAFPLTPTLSLGERVARFPPLDWPARLDLSKHGRWFSISPRERDGVRGKRCSDKPMLNLMAIGRAVPCAPRRWKVRTSPHDGAHGVTRPAWLPIGLSCLLLAAVALAGCKSVMVSAFFVALVS